MPVVLKNTIIVLSTVLVFGLLGSLVGAIGIIVIKNALTREENIKPKYDINRTFTYDLKTLPCTELEKYFTDIVKRTDIKCVPNGFQSSKFKAE